MLKTEISTMCREWSYKYLQSKKVPFFPLCGISKNKSTKKIIQFSIFLWFFNKFWKSWNQIFQNWSYLCTYIGIKSQKINKTSNFFDDFFAPKRVFWKNHYWVASEIDCFEPIFRFLMQFWFKKHSSDTWNRIGMYSELSGHSE